MVCNPVSVLLTSMDVLHFLLLKVHCVRFLVENTQTMKK